MDTVEHMTVGQTLGKARQEGGLSIEDVAAKIMVPQHYLIAIEEDRFDALPGQTYAIGFVRNYSKFLCLSPTDIVEQLKNQYVFPQAVDSYQIANGFVDAPRQSLLPSGGTVLAGLCVAMGVYGMWFAASATVPSVALPSSLPDLDLVEERAPIVEPAPVIEEVVEVAVAGDSVVLTPKPKPAPQQDVTVIQEAAPAPISAPEPEETVTAEVDADALPVTIHVVEEAWIEVRANGRIYYSGVKQAGEMLQIPAATAAIAQMTTGNAGGVSLAIGDWSSDVLGQPGRVRRNIALAPGQLIGQNDPAKRS